MLFVCTVYTFLQETITEAEITKAELMFKMFLRNFSKLYGAKNFTYNLHNLLHWGLTTRRWGPPCYISAFKFEDFNGFLSQRIKGSKYQGKELINTLHLAQGVEILRARVNRGCTQHSVDMQNVIELRNKCMKYKFSHAQKLQLSASNMKHVIVYYRAVIKKEIYTSKVYNRQKKRNNYTVCFTYSGTKSYGDILCFCESSDGQTKMVFVNTFQVEHMRTFIHPATNIVAKHIIPIKETDNVILLPVYSILFKVIRVSNFICIRPNTYEVNL
jgi:hypothetical protein